MPKITFVGAGSTVFAKNVLGDCLSTPVLQNSTIALYDISPERLKDSEAMLKAVARNLGAKATIKAYLGTENRRAALQDADFVINAIQVGGYEPSTVIDFEVPKRFGLRQTIADTLGIGGIFRALRTIPVMEDFAHDMEEVCPRAWLLNYTNPMAMLTGYVLANTGVRAVGLCHSVQACVPHLFNHLGMPYDDRVQWKIAGINHMAWLLEVTRDGADLYPEIKRRAFAITEKHDDMVRFEMMKRFGYYVTESSEHNAEYLPYFIKDRYPELIERFNIPLDEYPRRCIRQIEGWNNLREHLVNNPDLSHSRSSEYASYILESMVTNKPYKFGASVLNTGLIPNLPASACVEVPCFSDNSGIVPSFVGELPEQLAALNRTNINPQLLTIKAARTRKKEDVYHAAMLDPHTSSELSLDDIVALCDALFEAHGDMMPRYR